MGGKETEWGAEIVEDEFRGVAGGVPVAGQFLAFDPVGDGEVEGGALREVYEGETGGFLLVFFEDHESRVFSVRGEGGDFAHGELVPIVMRRPWDVDAMRE